MRPGRDELLSSVAGPEAKRSARTPLGPGLFASLRFQLLAVTALLMTLGLVIQANSEYRSERRDIERETGALARALVVGTSSTLEHLARVGDRAGMESVTSRLSGIPDLEVAALVAADGRVIAASRYELRGRPVAGTPVGPPAEAEAALRSGGVIVRSDAAVVAAAPVTLADGGVGRLVLRFDLRPRLAAATSGLRARTIEAALVRFAMLLVFAFALERRVFRPAKRIADAARALGAGRRGTRTGLVGDDELQSTGAAFDVMADEMESSEAALGRTRGLLDGLLQSLPVGVIAVQKSDYRVLFVNPQWWEFSGARIVAGSDYREIYAQVTLERPDGTPYPIEELSLPIVMRTGLPAEISDLVVARPDGRRIPLLVSSVPVNIGGEPGFDAAVCVAQDRRDLERAFRELRDWEERFQRVVEATGQVVYEWNFDTEEVRRSGSIQKVLGISDRTAQGLAQWESHLHPEDRVRVRDDLDASVRDRRPFDCEYRFRHGDGRWIFIRDRGIVQYDETGRARRMLGTMIDVTERRNLEHQLRHAQKMETVGTLAGGIAHDFNNQLTGVMGHLDLLGVELPAEDARQEHVKLAYRAAERCAELTSGLLAFSRRLASRPRPVSLNATVAETATLLARMLPATVRVEQALAPEPWSALADPGQVQQVLMNLCVNARDAMPDGGLLTLATRNVAIGPGGVPPTHSPGGWSVSHGAHPGMREGEFVELTVSDTGCGISPENLPRIFEPFFTTKSVGVGTGLGLAMVYGIVSAHHGWIDIESSPGQGATFRIYVPRAIGDPVDARDERRHRPRGGRETLLVVDDEAAVRELAARVLSGAGYQVVCASNGDEALAVYRRRGGAANGGPHGIHAVLLDLTMPGKTGRAVLEELRAFDPNVRVVLTSGYSPDLPDPGAGRLHGADGFLPKPYSSQPLLDAMRRVLDRALEPAPPGA